jgi:hypothetical protein
MTGTVIAFGLGILFGVCLGFRLQEWLGSKP